MDDSVSPPGAINFLPCVFDRALQAQCAACELARGHVVGELESIACASPLARAACGTLYGLLRAKSAFALGIKESRRVLPHAMVLKIQCGGLCGLKQAIAPAAHAPDVHRLVREAVDRHGSLELLPFSEIIQGVAAWKGRKRK